ncbi:sugar ABC transporter ATP-binding protein [Macrococcus capreoli]|uniref:sugar ABC transporter ATP-binding protein n=1 Tax=Macrococcus capreoli TaxID=2982690 RepID=UPI003F43397A
MHFEVANLDLTINTHHILKNVSIHFDQGKIHALIGGNGAGKSSLMKVLNGSYAYQKGTLSINDKSVTNFSDEIAYVAQEVDEVLFQSLTVYDNLTYKDRTKGFLYKQQRKQVLKDYINKFGLSFSLDTFVRDLSVSEKQLLVIVRAILENKRLLILDEPTASLSQREVDILFKELALLKENMAIIFISHRIPELLQIADDISVLKDGAISHSSPTNLYDAETLYQSIAGTSIVHTKKNHSSANKAFSFQNIKTDRLHNIDIHGFKGEVIGIAGLVGAGKTELCECLYHNLSHEKISYCPEERQKHGLVMPHSIRNNICFKSNHFFTHNKNEESLTLPLTNNIGLKYKSLNQPVQSLSGGNQQKVVLLRGLYQQSNIFILDEPTVGIDVGAKQDLFKIINQLAANGKTIIYASSDFNELMHVTDRIYTLYKGHIVDEQLTINTSESDLLHKTTGGIQHAV